MKIVNNKGQTPLSLAVSHLREETILLIEAAEEAQKEVRHVAHCTCATPVNRVLNSIVL